MTSVCKECGRLLKADEISLTRRLISRSATDFLCLTCMAQYFQCSEQLLENKIKQFKSWGCLLFVQDGADEDAEAE